jgi:hypothetical protein
MVPVFAAAWHFPKALLALQCLPIAARIDPLQSDFLQRIKDLVVFAGLVLA